MNKRKVLSILLLALITVTLAVSCSSNIDAPAANSEELAYVTFGNGHSRELGTSYLTEDYDELFWFYTAHKTDFYGTTGQVGLGSDGKPTEAVSKNGEAPAQGLSGRVGPFSQGAWKFKLYAYAKNATSNGPDKTNLIYASEEVAVTLKGNEVKNVPVSVSTQGSYGYVKFKNAYFRWLESTDIPAGQGGGEAAPQMEITLTKTGGTTITNNIVLSKVEGANRFNVQDELSIKTSANENPDRIPEGFYTAKVIVYLQQEASGNNVAIDNKGTPIFSQEFGLRVYGNATTYISGDMVEGVDSYVTFDVADQAMRVFTVNTTEATTVTANITALNGNKESAESVDENQKTTVTFPAGALAGAEHQLNVAVTPIASAEQKFQVSGTSNAQTAVSGIDLTMVKVEEQSGSLTQTPVTTFNGKSVTVTTYIATGLSGVEVKYLNGNTLENITGPITNTTGTPSYDPATGKLIFSTTHFSEYVVVAPVEALNVSTGIPYATLSSAIEGAGDGQEIQLMKNVALDSPIVINGGKVLTINLNGKNISYSDRPFRIYNAKVNFAGQGTIYESSDDKFGAIQVAGSSNDVSNYTVVSIGKDVTLRGWSGIFIDKDVANGYKNYGIVINLEGAAINPGADDHNHAGFGIYINGSNTNSTGNVPVININGARIQSLGAGIYAAGYAKWNISGSTTNITGVETAIEIRAGELTIEDGSFTATANSFICDPNGSGTTTSGAAIAIAQHTTKKDISVEINGGTFNGVKALNESNPQDNDPRPQVAMSVSGGEFNGEVTVTDTSAFISGGTFSSDPSVYIADGCTVARNNASKYVVTEHELWIDYADTNIPTDTDGKYLISTPAQLAGLAKLVNSGEDTFSGKTVIITADIDLAGKIWTPIGSNADSGNKFQGILDGSYTDENGNEKSHVISNMTVSQGASYRAAGFFGALNGTAQNLEFDSATVTSLSAPNSGGSTDNGNAVVAGSIYTSGTIENVTVKSSSVSANRYVGGIAGYVYGKVENCTVENTILTATPDNLTGAYDNGDKIGGIVGYLAEGNNNIVKNCNVSGNTIITGYRDIGGVVGYANAQTTVSGNTISGGKITVDNTHNYKGYTDGALHDANAIVGEASGNASVTDNNGDSSVTITRPSYTN